MGKEIAQGETSRLPKYPQFADVGACHEGLAGADDDQSIYLPVRGSLSKEIAPPFPRNVYKGDTPRKWEESPL